MTHSRDEGDAWKKEPARAFSDGALAISITITIMVLELEVPHGSDMAALKPLLPVFLSYVLSFILLPYGAVLLVAALAYYLLQSLIIAHQGQHSQLAATFRHDLKGKLSPVFPALGIALSFFRAWLARCMCVFVALMWLVPDRRRERVVVEPERSKGKRSGPHSHRAMRSDCGSRPIL